MLAHFSRVVCRPVAAAMPLTVYAGLAARTALPAVPLCSAPQATPTSCLCAPALDTLCDGDIALHQWVVHEFGVKDSVLPILRHHGITMEELRAQSTADRRILIMDALIRADHNHGSRKQCGGSARGTMRKRRLLLKLHRFKKSSFARRPNKLKIETDAQIQDNNDYDELNLSVVPVYESLVSRGRALLQAYRRDHISSRESC